MRTKTEKAISLFQSGCLKEALAIFRSFRIGFTREERRTLQIASESLSGNASFYQQIGIDTDSMISKSVEIITEKYLSNEKFSENRI
jgi:hypothetical protein|nr:MAG TPA: Tetratricopeptide repeat [Caudoviricetes sp.]